MARGSAQIQTDAGQGWTPARYRPTWVAGRNQRNLEVFMAVLAQGAGEGRFGLVHGPAGRGKTRTVQRWAAANRAIYVLMRHVWRTSELGVLQALCIELGLPRPPARKNQAFAEAAERLAADPVAVFVDEIEKAPGHLELFRDLAELSGAAVVVVGEDELVPVMQRNRRVWSRVFQRLQFEPVEPADVIFYCREAAGLELSPEAAAAIHRSPGGEDWRVIRRTLIDLVEIANSRQTRPIDEGLARQAVKMGFKGGKK